jgi:Na+/melibiose symporter-like transporter
LSDATPARENERGLIKIWHVASYAAGDALGGGVGQVLSLYYMYFLMYAMGLSPLLAGTVTGVTRLWDGVIDPLIGVLVDRTRSRWGRCRPWLPFSVLPVFVSYALLWTNLGIQGQWGRFFYFLFAYILFSTASSIGIVPYDALLPRMVAGYHERTNYSAYRMVFSGLASVGSTYVYEALIHVETTADYPANTRGFALLGLILGAVFALPLLITFFGSKETVAAARDEASPDLRETLRGYAQLLRCRLYRKCYFLTMLGAFSASAVVTALAIFVLLIYGNRSLSVPLLGKLTLLFLVVNLKGALEIGFFLPNVFLMKKYNKHRPLYLDLPLLAAGCAILLFASPSLPLWLSLTGIALIGAGSSCLSFVPNTLLPDLPDVDELICGRRREGVSVGLVKMGKQIVAGLSSFVFGLLLTAFHLNQENASPDQATFGALAAVKIMLCVLPLAASALMLMISRRYNLGGAEHAVIKARIAEKRSSGSARVPPEEQRLFEEITGQPFGTLWIAESAAPAVEICPRPD